MINSHLQPVSHMQPAIPTHPVRRQHTVPYSPPAMQYSHYHGYHQQLSHAHPPPQPHPQQWYPYQSMQVPIPRHYQQYSAPTMPVYPPAPPPAPPPMLNQPPPPPPPAHMPSASSIPSQDHLSPSTSTTSLNVPTPALTSSTASLPRSSIPSPTTRMPFYPPLPWYSLPEEPMPPKARRRKKQRAPQSLMEPVKLPSHKGLKDTNIENPIEPERDCRPAAPAVSEDETPVTSQAPSDADSTRPTTPSSAVPQNIPSRPQPAPAQSKPKIRPAVPRVPIVPVIPRIPTRPKNGLRVSISAASTSTKVIGVAEASSSAGEASSTVSQPRAEVSPTTSEGVSVTTSPPTKAPPKSWADLVRTKAPLPTTSSKSGGSDSAAHPNGFNVPKTSSIVDVLSSFDASSTAENAKIAFLEPRGLVNTGNMCYMNAVLQVLLFCVPFYSFLDSVGKRAAHSFKSDTPMLDAMIMFVREFSVIDSALTVEQLRMRLKENELEQYGESFIPEFVYEVIRRLPRFSSMRRGHQQDAEEFLGFLLEELHEECAKVMKPPTSPSTSGVLSPVTGPVSPTGENARPTSAITEKGWLEVGPRQKAAVTRSSGTIEIESPITKIFGGKIRSELRVPGKKTSVTLEPYQPLQLDIGSPHVNNIVDALKGLTKSETLQGDFKSPRGSDAKATKQVFIETLPPVLILHLKRFQYDNAGGTQKIWKKVGYPLELEIPKEVFPPHKRGGLVAHGGLPKYRLIGVVYHHGKNASGGHYTVDVRRQEGREWIRLDDTIIRRVRSEDVAEGGSEEDPKILAAALEQHKHNQSLGNNSNIFEQMRLDNEEKAASEKGWSQVNSAGTGTPIAGKKWSGAVNGVMTPADSSGKRTPVGRVQVKDNKVAYLLFYQKIAA